MNFLSTEIEQYKQFVQTLLGQTEKKKKVCTMMDMSVTSDKNLFAKVFEKLISPGDGNK